VSVGRSSWALRIIIGNRCNIGKATLSLPWAIVLASSAHRADRPLQNKWNRPRLPVTA
jgi:hypothetical protein